VHGKENIFGSHTEDQQPPQPTSAHFSPSPLPRQPDILIRAVPILHLKLLPTPVKASPAKFLLCLHFPSVVTETAVPCVQYHSDCWLPREYTFSFAKLVMSATGIPNTRKNGSASEAG
jgi:hypothetical protein